MRIETLHDGFKMPRALAAAFLAGLILLTGVLAGVPDARAGRNRVWIDTDAACGAGRTADPDDCLAVLILLRAPEVNVIGISTVFGNAPIVVTDRITRRLVQLAAGPGRTGPTVYRGAASPVASARARASQTAASTALRAALSQGPLTIVALGPLTNIAAALEGRPDLAAKVTRIVAVMGKRAGHIFHPSEGAKAGSLFGHGPIFRDFNLCKDIGAASKMLVMGVPAVLLPYEAARQVSLTGADLDRIERSGGVSRWVAVRSRAWLDYWRKGIGRDGFYPFDVLAAAYVISPELFVCAAQPARIARDRKTFGRFGGPQALLVGAPDTRPKTRRRLFTRGQRSQAAAPRYVGRVGYCTRVASGLHDWIVARLAAPGRRPRQPGVTSGRKTAAIRR